MRWYMQQDDLPGADVVFGEGRSVYNSRFFVSPDVVFAFDDTATSSIDMGFTEGTYHDCFPLDDGDLRKYLFLAPWPKVG